MRGKPSGTNKQALRKGGKETTEHMGRERDRGAIVGRRTQVENGAYRAGRGNGI